MSAVNAQTINPQFISISDDIIKAHGGHMEIKSSPGEGSVFSIYLEQKD